MSKIIHCLNLISYFVFETFLSIFKIETFEKFELEWQENILEELDPVKQMRVFKDNFGIIIFIFL